MIEFGLTDGGTAGLIYGFIVCFAGFTCVYLSIAEMASMFVFNIFLVLTSLILPTGPLQQVASIR